jgi:large subunit ribosomal protein L22
MALISAQLSDYRQSPRKVRIVVNALRGKKVRDAIVDLGFIAKRSALPLQKLLRSAVANAEAKNLSIDTLVIKEFTVDGGKILYRRMPASRGRSSILRKRTSHVKVVLSEPIITEKTKKPKSKSIKAKS